MTNTSRLDLVAARNRRSITNDALLLAAFTAIFFSLVAALWQPLAVVSTDVAPAASLASSVVEPSDAVVPTSTMPATAPCPPAAPTPSC